MRVSLLVAFAITTSHITVAQRTSPQWIVIGTHGQVVDVDPHPFLPESRRLKKQRELEDAELQQQNSIEQVVVARTNPSGGVGTKLQPINDSNDDGFYDDDDDEPTGVQVNDTDALGTESLIPDIEALLAARDTTDLDAWHDDVDDDEDEEVPIAPIVPVELDVASSAPFKTNLLVALDDEATFPPAVKGSVVFAELSCLFVLFIAYLVYAIPFWPNFSFGQKVCLFVAFSAAFLYQFVAISWYFGSISPDLTLGLSSLITRTISLGMVPITTTSVLGRARTALEREAVEPKPASTKASRRKARSG